jgi:hypothetical protein
VGRVELVDEMNYHLLPSAFILSCTTLGFRRHGGGAKWHQVSLVLQMQVLGKVHLKTKSEEGCSCKCSLIKEYLKI